MKERQQHLWVFRQASELVSGDNAQLKKLLQTRAPPKTPLTPTKAALPGLTSDLEDFKVPSYDSAQHEGLCAVNFDDRTYMLLPILT